MQPSVRTTRNKDQKHRRFKLKITSPSWSRRRNWGSGKPICYGEGRQFAQGRSTSYWTADFLSAPPTPCPLRPTTSSDALHGWKAVTFNGSHSQGPGTALPTHLEVFCLWWWVTPRACSGRHCCLLFLSSHENAAHWGTFEKLPGEDNFKDFWGSPNKRKPVLFALLVGQQFYPPSEEVPLKGLPHSPWNQGAMVSEVFS